MNLLSSACRFSVVVGTAVGCLLFAESGFAQATASTAERNILSGRRIEAVARETRDMLGYELLPSLTTTYKGAPFRTNRWGMRDKDYSLKPPRDTYRIALLGSSFSMGGGVPVEQTHEWLLEDRLNREGPGAPGRRYEILNFSGGGYGVMHYLVTAEQKAFRFTPNSVLVVIHAIEYTRMIDHLVSLTRARIPIHYPYIRERLQQAGVRPEMGEPELRRRLRRVSTDVVEWSYRRLAELCRERGVPLVGIAYIEPQTKRIARMKMVADVAAAAGIPILSLEGAYAGRPLFSVTLERDAHLSALGHRLVADRLFHLLRENDTRALKLGFPPSDGIGRP